MLLFSYRLSMDPAIILIRCPSLVTPASLSVACRLVDCSILAEIKPLKNRGKMPGMVFFKEPKTGLKNLK